jgi:DNA-binding CsgD family transcriptional regulator
VIGRTGPDLGLWGAGALREELERQVKQTGHLRSVDVQIQTKDGHASDYLLSAETVSIHGEQCVLTVMLDITERKQTEAELLTAIEAVMQDTSWFGQKIVEKLASLTGRNRAKPNGPAVSDLTPRGRDVLGLIAQGLGDEEIANMLGMSRNTVKNHVSAIYKITNVRRRSALVVWARERGLGGQAKAPQKQRRGRSRTSRPDE